MALSQSKIPPQKREGLLDFVDDGECFRAHIEFRLWSSPGAASLSGQLCVIFLIGGVNMMPGSVSTSLRRAVHARKAADSLRPLAAGAGVALPIGLGWAHPMSRSRGGGPAVNNPLP